MSLYSKLIPIYCPKYNKIEFYHYGKDLYRYQKYQSTKYYHL